MSVTVNERIEERLKEILQLLKERLPEDANFEIPTECPDCGLVCNTQEDFADHDCEEGNGYRS